MTGGLGFTTLMKSVLRTNKSFLRHSDLIKSKIDNLEYHIGHDKLEYKHMSDEELEKFRQKLKLEAKLERRKTLTILFITLFICSCGIIMIYLILKN